MTLPEPVAWDSSPSAANLTTFTALKGLLQLGWLFKVFAWLIARSETITLGWPHRWSISLFFPGKNQQVCSFLDFCLPVDYSYSKLTTKTLLFLTPTLFLTASPQIINAKETSSTNPSRLMIPSIALDSAIVPVGWKQIEVNGQTYGQWEVDDNRVGWHNLSAPLGQPGNSVFNGHSNIYAQVFRNLNQVEIGDRIIAFADDQVYTYVVAAKFLVQEKGVTIQKRFENAQLILPTPDERLTLVTCALPGATHRLIVIAYPETSH